MGETGIWIPNLEKEGAGATALAAIAGGVRAIEGSNYARALPGEVPGAERAITMESIFRGGTDAETGYGGEKLGRLGKISPEFHGSKLLGGEVISGPGGRYVSRGGDFGGLLGEGTAINTAMLDGLLGARDSDGMRLGGTYPTVRGAATSDPVAGGGVGGGMAGGGYGGGGISGGGPVVPTYMSDWSKFMPTDFSLGEAMYDTSGREVAPGGFLYQPHAADYLGGMSAPGSGYGGGYGGGYVGGAGGGLLGGSPPVTYTPPPGAGAPGGALRVGSPSGSAATSGLRDGLTPGMHSTHLGAYETADGTWVWGPVPSGGDDDVGAGAVSHSPGEDVTMGYGLLGMTPWGAVAAHDITPSAAHTTYGSDAELDAGIAAGMEMGHSETAEEAAAAGWP